jgi:hypothetical protein
MSFVDDCTPIVANFNNDGGAYSADVVYDSSNPSATWTLESGDGTKTVGGTVRDGAGNLRTLGGQTIVLDATVPTTPSGSLASSVSCAGSDRTVYLAFGTSTDTNLRGYRVYRSTDGVTFSQLTTVSGSPASDNHKKSLESVQYYVVAYDKAGNESSPTNVVALTKNQCS